MQNQYLHHIIILLITLCLFISCQSETERNPVEEMTPVDLEKPELFIDFEQGGLAQPAAIERFNDDHLAILDPKRLEVLVFDYEGTRQQNFGSEGKGPGEFVSPRYINKSPNYFNVVDAELYRINQYDYSGNFVQSFNFADNPYNSNITVMEEEKYYAGSMGMDGSLVKLVDAENDTVRYFGEATGEEYRPGDLEPERQALANGNIPSMYENQITMYYSGDHLYVFLDVHSRLQKYSPAGKLIWETAIDLPANQTIFERAVERAKDAPPSAVPSYRFVISMKVIDGETYLYWTPAEGHTRKMVRVNADGEVAALYHIPEEQPTFFDFTVDPDEEMLYLTAPEMGQVYRTRLTE